MLKSNMFYLVFLGQIVMISWYFPQLLVKRVKHIIQTYPPSEYPKLYPVSAAHIQQTLNTYRLANLVILVFGLVLLLSGIFSANGELLNWDTQSVVAGYFLLQYSPMIIINNNPGFAFFNPTRKPSTLTRRSAVLRPRRLLDFISPAALALAIAVYIGFILLVLSTPQLWRAGYWNIFFVTLLNVFFVGYITWILRSKLKDPYIAYADRLRQIQSNIRIAVFGSIAGTIFLAIAVGLQNYAPAMVDTASSLYFQIVCLASLWAFQINNFNFEVYKADPDPETG